MTKASEKFCLDIPLKLEENWVKVFTCLAVFISVYRTTEDTKIFKKFSREEEDRINWGDVSFLLQRKL